mgnify:CR=1 FL=1
MGKFLIGLLIGITIAGGFAYYLSYAPNEIVNKASNQTNINTNTDTILLEPSTKLQSTTTDNTFINNKDNTKTEQKDDTKDDNYDFYNILSDGNNKMSSANTTNNNKNNTNNNLGTNNSSANITPATQNKTITIEIAGLSQDDANDTKAKLALIGIDADLKSSQSGDTINNKIIIGPFNNKKEAQEIKDQILNENITNHSIAIKYK